MLTIIGDWCSYFFLIIIIIIKNLKVKILLKLLCIRKKKKKKKIEFSKFYNNSRGCVRGHTATSYKQKANLLLLFSFLLLKVTTKQSTKAFRNKNLKSANGRRRRRRMAGHFRNSAGDGGIIGYMVFSFTVNHLISNFLVFLLPSSIRFFS